MDNMAWATGHGHFSGREVGPEQGSRRPPCSPPAADFSAERVGIKIYESSV
jgi:hypothetical protein